MASESNELLEAGSVQLSKEKGLFNKASVFKNRMQDIFKNYDIERVVVEENLQSFRSGMSSAKTLQSLAKFNGIACYLVQVLSGIEPEFVNVISARSKLEIKINRKAEESTKQQVLAWVKKHDSFKDFSWPTKTLKHGPRANQTIDDPSCFDIADASVVALYSIFEQVKK